MSKYFIALLLFFVALPLRAEVRLLEKELIFPADGSVVPTCHGSTIVEIPDGTLLAAWFAGTGEGFPDVAIWMSRKEEGKDWEYPHPIAVGVEDGERVCCWNPAFVQWGDDGPLVLFFKVGRNPSIWHGEMMISRDGGVTWGEREKLPELIEGPAKNKPVVLPDGSLLVGAAVNESVHVEILPKLGGTWRRTPPLISKDDPETIQPTILTYPDGRIQLLCRSRDPKDGHIMQIWSEDGGATWGKVSATELPNPNAGIDSVTLQDGRKLLVYNPTVKKGRNRADLAVAISEDGEQWEQVIQLESGPNDAEFSYPSVIQKSDGTVHILYTWQRGSISHVVLSVD